MKVTASARPEHPSPAPSVPDQLMLNFARHSNAANSGMKAAREPYYLGSATTSQR
ncbi:hypothetical protein FIBSPDRAFT_859263 [Athelia psychrophila]|uniref:Uncharacterized protein n=1 Tax=Athelia psychrophila TaxID=1759441 RepID=A0A166LC42_9AGAM|nr:hypothetical protein FIBSPDRAFT_880025 [Fibularhizoctonia sp. CBS 109695]KZP22796.1 hypothetical protein FIBSPDRAFT_859263 [Fibularhizoctonia sp. CBS 109695]